MNAQQPIQLSPERVEEIERIEFIAFDWAHAAYLKGCGMSGIQNIDDHRKRLRAALLAASTAREADIALLRARYDWCRTRLAIEDVERLESEFWGTPDEAESLKTDAAIDAARALKETT